VAGGVLSQPRAKITHQRGYRAAVPIRAGAKFGRASALRLPQHLQVNRCSRLDTHPGQRFAADGCPMARGDELPPAGKLDRVFKALLPALRCHQANISALAEVNFT
jgi:hypothetical protein